MKMLFVTALLLTNLFNSAKIKERHLETGDAIPHFTLTDQDSHTFNVADHIGKKIMVIYFYPKDESAVCTKEACSFRDSYTDFTKAGALVIGINSGTVQSHKEFQQHHQLPFTLLSDPDNKVLKQFGVKGNIFVTGRETFVIGLDGKVGYSYSALLEGHKHVEQALSYIKAAKH